MIDHGLRLDVLKCSQQYKPGLREVEAYDFRIEARYVAAVKDLENVSLPLLDQLEALMDSPLELLMSSTLKG
ncbi:hypothetical protein Tco_0515747, partial [Tanacetum coccineum]